MGCSADSGVVWLHTTASPDPWKGWQAGTVKFSPGFPRGRRNESRDRVGEDVARAVVNWCARSFFLCLYLSDSYHAGGCHVTFILFYGAFSPVNLLLIN